MNYLKLIVAVFLVCSLQSVFGQQGDNYLKLMQDLVLVDSTEIKDTFKDGTPKHVGLMKYYQHRDYVYEMNVGEHTRYYKDGSRTVSVYGDWGTELITRSYDSDDNLIMEWLTTKVETSVLNLDAFFSTNKHITYNTAFKDYRYDYKLCKYYLKKTGQYSNSKKVGLWQYFYPSGELKKEKSY